MTATWPGLTLVVPTRNRPAELRTMLRSLAAQTPTPAHVIVVDSSDETDEGLAEDVRDLPIEHVRFDGPPSAAGQRNAGIARVADDAQFVCLFDDDQTFQPGALQAMRSFWAEAPSDVAGAGFHIVNEPDRSGGWLKQSRLAAWLGLYAREPGRVAPSGWQSVHGHIEGRLDVEWLGSGVVVWRRAVLAEHPFDEFFVGYSYLEDVDHSYGISRSHRLVFVGDAPVHHDPSPQARPSHVRFGEYEIRNRLYLVRKHGLSMASCLLAMVVRWCLSVGQGIVRPSSGGLARAWGNVVGLVRHHGVRPEPQGDA